jgi:hypothetical protein
MVLIRSIMLLAGVLAVLLLGVAPPPRTMRRRPVTGPPRAITPARIGPELPGLR